jgi:hypothetical protein
MNRECEVEALNESILSELAIEELEERAELSPIGTLDLLVTKTQLVSQSAWLAADCGVQCNGNCTSQCGSNAGMFERESLILLP